MRIFGFEIRRPEDESKENLVSFAEPLNDDGALTVGAPVGGSYGMVLDLEGQAKSEAELVTKYRQMLNNPEIQAAVDEIVNEAIAVDSHNNVINIILDDLKVGKKVKDLIEEEFRNVLRLLDFSNQGYEIASKFYVDGRLNYHAIVDEKNPKMGIQELRYLDPRKIRLIREMVEPRVNTRDPNEAFAKVVKQEYYMYSETGFGANAGSNYTVNIGNGGLRIAKDSIIRVTSGILNESNTVVLSHLHPAFKPLNQLRMLEDATVIYTMTRAPERRIFYVDVGNLPKSKAEQYLYDMMVRHKNRVTYDPTTGEVRDDRKMMTMTEDYWFPRRGGNRSTEVETLPAGGGLGNNENLAYFQTKLYKSLNVPIARLQPETMYSFGRTSETTREELKFAKFIRRFRTRLSILFDRCLERQLILKGIITPSEWKDVQNSIRYDFVKDNFFEELKEAELLREKISTLRDIEEHVGKYFSRSWIKKNVLYLTDDQIEEMNQEIAQEKELELEQEAEVAQRQQQLMGGQEEEQPEQEQQDQNPTESYSMVTETKKQLFREVINKNK